MDKMCNAVYYNLSLCRVIVMSNLIYKILQIFKAHTESPAEKHESEST